MATFINVDCLLPTKILIRYRCSSDQCIRGFKEALWKSAQFANLKAPENYIFIFMNKNGKQERCMDESQRLCDLCMFTPLLKIEENEERTTASDFTKSIDVLIGKVTVEANIGPEVEDYWTAVATRCREVIEERNRFSWDEMVRYCAPPDLEGLGTFTQAEFIVTVLLSIANHPCEQLQVAALATDTVESFIEKIQSLVHSSERESVKNVVLKVCGLEEYLIGNHLLCQYSYIRKNVSRQKVPTLVLMPKSAVQLPCHPEQFMAPNILMGKSIKNNSSQSHRRDTWEINDHLRIRVVNACRLSVPNNTMIKAHVAVYFGDVLLCRPQTTRPVCAHIKYGALVWTWDEMVELDISISDLPCGSKLCLELHGVDVEDERRNKPLAWVNQSVFDYRKHLCRGITTLSCWPFDPDDLANESLRYGHHGTTVQNPNVVDAISIMVHYPEFSEGTLVYPDETKILEIGINFSACRDLPVPTSDDILEINTVLSRVLVTELNAHEKDLIWRFRTFLIDKPSSLPILLKSVKWNFHKDVAMLHSTLSRWKPLLPFEALELLDYGNQDPVVREFAVKSVAEFSDTELLQYLLQLCQALKYESHLDCPLGRLLLERAWKNKRIGHFLFWHLRSEIESPEVNLRFALMLETYLRGSPNHIAELYNQACGMEKMVVIAQLLHSRKFKNKVDRDSAYQSMAGLLSDENFKNILSGIHTSPLNPKQRLGELCAEKSSFFDSNRRPLLLVYRNVAESNVLEDTAIIFKFGTDLHQDMLLLQIIEVMQMLWEESDLGIRVLPYGCMVTGLNMGFIEVVRNAETMESIYEKYKTTCDTKSHVLYQWLKDRNPTEKSLQCAMEAFCCSCAGYSVATYVLGIGDRHSDNIMITEDGQLFHIDFSHFLGNFKEVLGVRRERVPFVLPQDFEIIIEKHYGFDRFAKLCEDAYMILRQNAYRYTKLLAMMVQTGMPELRSRRDLNYVQDALVLEKSDLEAREHFRAKLQEARCNAWSTSLNWFLHGLAKETGD